MENYTNYAPSYPESGDSSPRSREVDFETPPPWEDQNQPQSYKVKFMCSYGGKIHPRPHDNQLSYVGGETKILAVDRNIKFGALVSKLSGLCDYDGIMFKYQLPGEDLDALISVSNDDDLEHMMHEYDRLYRASPKPARLRLFMFPTNPDPISRSTSAVSQRSFGSEEGRSEKERFVEALNSGPVLDSPVAPPRQNNNVDLLFGGLDKGVAQTSAPPQVQQTNHHQIRDPRDPLLEAEVFQSPSGDDRGMPLDPIQKHIQDLQRLRLEEQQGLYERNSDENLTGMYLGGDYYVQKLQEKVAQVPGSGQIQQGYWPDKQISGGGVYQAPPLAGDQQFYMMPPPQGGPYHPHPHHHPQMVRPMNPPVGQGYYTVSRMQPPEVYRDQQQIYNSTMPPPVVAAPPAQPPQAQGPPRMPTMGRPVGTSAGIGVGMVDATQYSQMGYDGGVGRQVYYNAAGGQVMSGPPPPGSSAPPYQAVPTDMRQGGGVNHDGNKVVPKATQSLV
ncbi:hypothetical protein LIER_10885 [Lithospermum erythrorhizon]|uniref:PB1 domain-containing protein n=1 Tax=Lithospermum erythrorhizon TaxID=34254 RepID=A0AAV3PKW8_LITER